MRLLFLAAVVGGLEQGQSRRLFLRTAATTALFLPMVSGAADESEFNEMNVEGGGRVKIPAVWKRENGALSDPVLGLVTSSVVAHSLPCAAGDVGALGGKIDTFDLKKLGLKAPRERGDIVSAHVRRENDLVFYDWDLAVAPETCPKSQQLVVTTCLPDEVALVSAVVKDGTLYVLECAVGPREWRNFAKALRTMRNSFQV